MATQKQVLSYTTADWTSSLQTETVFTCPAGKIARIEFNYINTQRSSAGTNNYVLDCEMYIVPAGSSYRRSFGHLSAPTTSNANGYTIFPMTAEKRIHYGDATNTNYGLYQNSFGDAYSNPTSVANTYVFPGEIYLNSGDAFKIDFSNANPYSMYINGLILIEDSDA